MKMDAIAVIINDQPLSIQDSKDIINQLKIDDGFLIDYIVRAIKSEKIPLCSIKDLATLSITRVCDATIANIPSSSSSVDPLQGMEAIATAVPCSAETPVQSTSHFSNHVEKKNVWINKGKPTQENKDATYQMLQIRASEKYVKKFNNKSSVKLDLWKNIASELQELAYNVDAKSCRQKFANLYSKYIKFRQHVKTTGVETREPPELYELLHQIFGQKDKVNLQYVSDTLDTIEVLEKTSVTDEIFSTEDFLTETNQDTGSEGLDLQSNICNGTDKLPNQQDDSLEVSSSSKLSNTFLGKGKENLNKTSEQKSVPKKHEVTKSDILNAITSNQKEQMQQQDKQFGNIMNVLSEQNQLLKQQNSQRDDFLSLMREFLKPNKKRKHSDSDSD